jgi:peroxiredoxin
MARRTIKIPKKSSKEIEMSESEKVDDILSSIDSIQGKQPKMASSSSSFPLTKIVMIVAFFAIISLGVLSLGNYQFTQPDPRGSTISEELDFTFQLISGENVKLSDYEGKPILLDLMGTQCPPCTTQIEELKTVYANFRNVQILSVSVADDSIDSLSQYKDLHGITWPIGLDTTHAGREAFSATSIPTIAFINSAGILKQHEHGLTEYATLANWIKAG